MANQPAPPTTTYPPSEIGVESTTTGHQMLPTRPSFHLRASSPTCNVAPVVGLAPTENHSKCDKKMYENVGAPFAVSCAIMEITNFYIFLRVSEVRNQNNIDT